MIEKVLLPIIRKAIPNLIAEELVRVQPMGDEREMLLYEIGKIEEEKLTREKNQTQKINTHPKYP